MSCLGSDLLDELNSLRRSYLREEEREENKGQLRRILSQVSGALERFVLVGSGKAVVPWRVSAGTKPENFVTVPLDFKAGQTSVATVHLVEVHSFCQKGKVKHPSEGVPELFTLGERLHVYPLPPGLRKKENTTALVVMHFLLFVCNWLRESSFKSNKALRNDIFCQRSCPGLGDKKTIVRSLELMGQIDCYYQTARAHNPTLIAGLTWTMQQHHSNFVTACSPRYLRLLQQDECRRSSPWRSRRPSSGIEKGQQAPAPEPGGGSPLDSWGTPFDPTKPKAEVAVLPDQGAPVPTALNRKSALRVNDLLTPELIFKLKSTFEAKATQPQEDGNNIQEIKDLLDEEITSTEALLGKEIQKITKKDIQTLAASIRKLQGWKSLAMSAQAKERKTEADKREQESQQCIEIQRAIDTKFQAWEANAKWQ
eukprot:g62890.t1